MLDGGRTFPRTPARDEALDWRRSWLCLAGGTSSALLAYMAFLLHFNLSAAGSLELLLVIIAALRWGFPEATAVSLVAVTGLNFLFMAPLFTLTVADPANWVSLATFEITALLVSRLSARAHLNAVEAENQRQRAIKLYELSRAILLIDSREGIQEQLAAVIREIIHVEDVHISLFARSRAVPLPLTANTLSSSSLQESSALDDSTDTVSRTLRIGTTAIGTLKLTGWQYDSMLADAVASLAAIAVERARAVQEESRAASERDVEKLRTAVLDGLAHGFKTPLTAIQTASSGLLVIGETNATQTELISIIDEQATLLSHLTTKLLQTASLESREVRLQKTKESMRALTESVIALLDLATRQRFVLSVGEDVGECLVDKDLITLALTQLVDNAVKYSAIEEPVVLSVKRDNGEVIVSVESRGTPILPGEADKIFERFFRGSNSLRGPTGTGLGLSIVRKVASAHGGEVSLQIDGERTTFFFTVPL